MIKAGLEIGKEYQNSREKLKLNQIPFKKKLNCWKFLKKILILKGKKKTKNLLSDKQYLF